MKAFVLALLLCATAVAGEKPKAPLAPALLSAKTVMLQGNQKSVEDAFDELTRWGRFQIVTDKTKADLVFEFVHIEEPVADYRKFVYREALEIHDTRSNEPLYQDLTSSKAHDLIRKLRKRLEQH